MKMDEVGEVCTKPGCKCQKTTPIRKLINENQDAFTVFYSLRTICSVLKNIIENPKELKFRTLKLSNPKVHKFLLEPVGALEILKISGFSMVNEGELYLSEEKDINILKEMLELLYVATYNVFGNVSVTSNPTEEELQKLREDRFEELQEQRKKKEFEKQMTSKLEAHFRSCRDDVSSRVIRTSKKQQIGSGSSNIHKFSNDELFQGGSG